MFLPESIKKMIGDREYEIDNIGMSGSQVLCFDDMVLKIEASGRMSDNEYSMMKWLGGRLPVPRVLVFEQAEGSNYLLMSRAEGEMLCDSSYLHQPGKLVDLLAQALELLWSVDISDLSDCITLDDKLLIAQRNIKLGMCDTENVEPETYGENGFRSPEHLLQWLIDNKPNEQPVLSHGDFCLPNIFANASRISGFIDLGRCGISDRYQDIALCWRSLKHNFDGSFGFCDKSFNADVLFDALGIKCDRELLRYYILLDELF